MSFLGLLQHAVGCLFTVLTIQTGSIEKNDRTYVGLRRHYHVGLRRHLLGATTALP